jgi:hypothetical protein
MADSSADTTTLVVVAAVVVVAVMWSRRGGMMYGSGTTRPTAGGSSTTSDVLAVVRDIFSGLKDAWKTTHSSDPNADYVIPSSSTSDSSEYGGGLSPGGSAVDPTCMEGYVGDDGIFVCTA